MESNNNRCLICNNLLNSSYILANYGLCKNCFKKMPLKYETIIVNKYPCLILYEYDDFVEELIVRIKGYGDKKLSTVFIDPIKDYLRIKYLGYTILPCPSTKQSDKKRGFNHVKEMFKPLNLHIINCFSKTKNHKQADQSKYERSKIKEYINLDTTNLSKSKKYLIVDDITTTHQTLKTCIKLLENSGITNIKLLVIASK